MCLIVLAHRTYPGFPLLLAANRDEFYSRPTAAAAEWADAPGVVAGRDLRSGGSWLGVTPDGRWAAVTNFRDSPESRRDGPSRGELVADFLRSGFAAELYLRRILPRIHLYNGFNLLVGDPGGVFWLSNRLARSPVDGREDLAYSRLAPASYGLSNDLLDTPWPKVTRAKQELAALLSRPDPPSHDHLLDLLLDRATDDDRDLPRRGVSVEVERALSSAFVALPDYGTRASTVLSIADSGQIIFCERRFGPSGIPEGEVRIELTMSTGSR